MNFGIRRKRLLESRGYNSSHLPWPIAEIERRLQLTTLPSSNGVMKFPQDMDAQINSPPKILVQCRICHDEDEESKMETPCCCCGTLKFAHRKCVQRWCNEKGNTTCEICQQQFRPGYTAPPLPPLFNYDDSPINFGYIWGIQNDHFMTMFNFNANHEFQELDFEYSAPSPTSLLLIRIVATMFIVLLVLCDTLPIIVVLSEVQEYSLTLFTLVFLRFIGMLVPIYIMVKVITAIQRLQRQDYYSHVQFHEENDLEQSQLRVIHIE
ncbi:hypothetical protein RIF29_14042 [Crotalaria pallida]|uniref:RING-CH-type domain-containing protein n=1 Tax=Crotalaria pallida TaxID=3830 RepID=A0AAN9IHV9_CROPI